MKTITLVVGTDSTSGPFPPNYPAGAVGYIAAGSNPAGSSAGNMSSFTYFGATILAIANDASVPTQFMVALAGSFDQEFLGAVTTPDSCVYEPTAASFVVSTVNGASVTSWIWPLASGGSVLTSHTVYIADTGDTLVELEGYSDASTQINLSWTNIVPIPISSYELYRGVGSATPTLYQTLSNTTLAYEDTGLTANTEYTYYVVGVDTDGYTDYTDAVSNTVTIWTPASGISATFNCNCESSPLPADGWTIDSLANLRQRVLIRCGYAAQAANPPPGMISLVNEFLRDAQNQLYRQHSEFRGKRMYAWQMEPNVRYYGISQDESDCRTIDVLSIDWVGFEDQNQAWYPLINGIDPVLYTRAQISTGWPTHYEIRSCIEIFPAPQAPYTLWIKGRFGLDPFTADTDNTTIDAEGVYLLAAGMMKAHYGQPDASAVMTQAANYTKYLVAGQHGTRRFVPRTRVQTPMTPPRFLPLEE